MQACVLPVQVDHIRGDRRGRGGWHVCSTLPGRPLWFLVWGR